eukprot:1097702-Pleurochrysis_carterae.AAC.18
MPSVIPDQAVGGGWGASELAVRESGGPETRQLKIKELASVRNDDVMKSPPPSCSRPSRNRSKYFAPPLTVANEKWKTSKQHARTSWSEASP